MQLDQLTLDQAPHLVGSHADNDKGPASFHDNCLDRIQVKIPQVIHQLAEPSPAQRKMDAEQVDEQFLNPGSKLARHSVFEDS
jgi:hypothetical protein